MNCLIINNPNSGKCKSINELDHIKSRLLEKYESVDIVNTVERKEATVISEQNRLKYHTYVVVGGDGTYSEVLQGLLDKDVKPLIGYVPTGTVNDFAKNCNIPCDVEGAVDIILKEKVVTRSALFINGKVAAYIITTGMLTSSSYTAPQETKKRLGKLAYYLEVLIRDRYRKGVQLKVTSKKLHEGYFTIIVCLHGLSVGGFRVFNNYDQNDNEMRVVMIKRKKGPWGYIWSLGRLLKVLVKKVDNVRPNKYIVVEKLSDIKIEAITDDVQWNVDGERGPVGNIKVSIKSNQYKAIVG